MLKSAGKGEPETSACKDFGDDIYEIVGCVRAVITNVINLRNRGYEPDREGMGTTLLEVCLCTAIDACLTYISNVLQLIYRHQPEALKSKEKIEIGWPLQFNSTDELIHALAERKVHELSYKSLSDLDEYLSDRHGISLFSEEGHRSRAVQLVDYRNLIVHNRGRVNRIFKERNPQLTAAVGDRLQYTITENYEGIKFLLHWIIDLDFRICDKYPIPTQPRIPRPKIPYPPEIEI